MKTHKAHALALPLSLALAGALVVSCGDGAFFEQF